MTNIFFLLYFSAITENNLRWGRYSIYSANSVVTKLKYPSIQLFFGAVFEIAWNLPIRICNG